MSKNSGNHGPPTTIPEILRSLPRWVGWELRPDPKNPKKKRKVPVHPDGRNFSTKLDTPYPFEEIVESGYEPGFVLTGGVEVDGRRLIGADLDACRDPDTGALQPWASEFLQAFGQSYAEVTPSGEGLRQWFLVDQAPEGELRKIRGLVAAPNTTKKPEIEIYGLGRPCYVTVSGERLASASAEIERARSLGWLTKRHPTLEQPSDIELPTGQGPVPDLDDIDVAVRAHGDGRLLVEGEWEKVVPDESASEGYYRLAQRVLRAARDHGRQAVEYLIHRTAYGAGLVDSAEPDRYGRETWVAKEIARIAAKAPRPSSKVFDGFDVEGWTSEHVRDPKAKEKRLAAKEKSGKVVIADDYVKLVGRRRWLVHNLLPTHGLAEIFGDPGQGKTPVALHLAISTAAELPTWFGWDLENHGPVVYFVGEDDSGVRDRFIAQADQLDPLLLGAGIPLYFTTEPGRINDETNVDAWIQAILEATGGIMPRLVVIDTLSRNFGSGSDSDTEAMLDYVAGCARLERRLGELAGVNDKTLVLHVHHSSHAHKDRSRGSTVLPAALDTSIKVERVGRYKIVLSSKKVKGAAEPDPWTGTLEPVELGLDEKGRPITAITLRDGPPDPAAPFEPVEDEVLKLVEAVIELDGRKVSQREFADHVGLGRQALRNRLEQAVDAGLVEARRGASTRSKTSYFATPEGVKAVENPATHERFVGCEDGATHEATHDNPNGSNDESQE